MVDFSILGAGVAGLCVASVLRERGARVEVIDPAGLPAAHGCSWWAGGMLAPYCERENAEEPVLRLGQMALKWWQSRTKVVERGTLVVANGRDRPDLDRFARRTEGWERAEARSLEPDLAAFGTGLHYPSEAHLTPRQALADLVAALGEECFRREGPARGAVIDCRGLAARDVLQDLRGVRGEMVVLRCPSVELSRPVRLLHPRIPLYVVPRGDGVFMLGATMIEAEDRAPVRVRSLLEMLSAAFALTPAFGEAEVLEVGVDCRPAFPDNLPRIRHKDGVTYANGLYRHGYLLSPALAQGVADWVLDGKKTELFDASFA